MKELVIISGKGGTGKTSLAGALAVLAGNKVLVDCDVDAANLHLLLNPRVEKEEPFYGLPKAVIDREQCLECELCMELCQFGAIRNFTVSELACEGCGVCFHACPDRAIRMVEHQAGRLYVSSTRYGPLVHAQLGIAEGNSGKLVSAVRQRAKEIAEKEGYGLIITDGPPGIGCPVIACLSGADVVLVVTEPTLSGRHDLERVLRLVEHFQEKAAVCVNKWDLSPENTREIENFCRQKEIALIGKIPYDPAVNEAVRQKVPVVLHNSGAAGEEIVNLWDNLVKMLS
ncbi:MAG: ATP-binding protein [Armatimonadetes bacterium]|nr:ATP-binding protein [Armatimonadota bacterium]